MFWAVNLLFLSLYLLHKDCVVSFGRHSCVCRCDGDSESVAGEISLAPTPLARHRGHLLQIPSDQWFHHTALHHYLHTIIFLIYKSKGQVAEVFTSQSNGRWFKSHHYPCSLLAIKTTNPAERNYKKNPCRFKEKGTTAMLNRELNSSYAGPLS